MKRGPVSSFPGTATVTLQLTTSPGTGIDPPSGSYMARIDSGLGDSGPLSSFRTSAAVEFVKSGEPQTLTFVVEDVAVWPEGSTHFIVTYEVGER